MSYYIERIDKAKDFETLCNIVEEAADDTGITNEDYCNVYARCVNKAQTMVN